MLLVFLSFSPHNVKFHTLPVLLLYNGFKLLFFKVFLVPQGICFLVFALYENYVLVFLLQSFVQSFLLVFVVNYRLLIPTKSLLQLLFPKSHLSIAIRQKVFEPFIFQLQVVEFGLLLLHQVRVVQGFKGDFVDV